MLISTEFFRFNKAVEHFYYALLFSSDEYAASGASTWGSWVAQGFDLAIRAAPPAVHQSDRLMVDSVPGRRFELTAASDNYRALTRLSEVLQEIERARTNLAGNSEEARMQALLDNPAIDRGLLRPVRESLKRNPVAAEASDAIGSMIKRGLSALTNWQIQSVKISVH